MRTRPVVPVTLILVMAAGGLAAGAVAQEPVSPEPYLGQLPPLLHRALLFQQPRFTDFQLAPDGKRIAFLQLEQGRTTLRVVDRGQPLTRARPALADTTWPVQAFAWTRDSRNLLFTQDRVGDGRVHVYLVPVGAPPEGATPLPTSRDLTPYGAVRASIQAVPRETRHSIVVAMNDPDRTGNDAYRIDLASGARTLLRRDTTGVTRWIVDRHGVIQLAERPGPKGLDVLVLDGEYLAPFARTCPQARGCGVLHFDQQDDGVYMADVLGDDDRSGLYLFPLGYSGTELLARDPTKTVDVDRAVFGEATDALEAVYFNSDRIRIYALTDTFRRDYQAVQSKVGNVDIYFGSSSADERYHIVTTRSDIEPGTIYLYDRVHGRISQLYRELPELPRDALAHVQTVRYQTRDGAHIHGYLTLPSGVDDKNLPLVVLPHDGPWARDTWGYHAWAQLLANRGYAVLQPNYRGSRGFGDTFQNAGNGQWGTGVMQHDLTDGVRWLVGAGVVDPARVAIVGHGYGGYAALAGLAFTPGLYAAGVDIDGPADLPAWVRAVPAEPARIRARVLRRVGDPDSAADARRLHRQSPLFAAGNIRAPLLVVQGAGSPPAVQSAAASLVAELRRLGRPVQRLTVPGAAADAAADARNPDVIAAVEAFLARTLGGRAEAGPATSSTLDGTGPVPYIPAACTAQSEKPARARETVPPRGA